MKNLVYLSEIEKHAIELTHKCESKIKICKQIEPILSKFNSKKITKKIQTTLKKELSDY